MPEPPFAVDATSVVPGLVLSFRAHAPRPWDPERDIDVELPGRWVEHGGQDWVFLDKEHERWLAQRARHLGIELAQNDHTTWRLTAGDAARLLASLLDAGATLLPTPPGGEH